VAQVQSDYRGQFGFLYSLERTIKSCALFAYAMVQSALGLFSRDRANQARLLRWKFMGKLSAHLRHSTSRMEESM